MTIAHLTASFQFGGPERQMLGLAQALPSEFRSIFFTFSEDARCASFISAARGCGFVAESLSADTPQFPAMVAELTQTLVDHNVNVLCCHGYKANFVGAVAAMRCDIPSVFVVRGWTGENVKVSSYEMLDAHRLRQAARVVCVARSQAQMMRRLGVSPQRLVVIPNAVSTSRFNGGDEHARAQLRRYLPHKELIIGAAGRLVKEKGFLDLLEVAKVTVTLDPRVGYVLFGDGPLRDVLSSKIQEYRLQHHVVLAGFRRDLDFVLPQLDLFVHPSEREGLPNVVLEACAAGVPVIATDVGGTPEIIRHGWNGFVIRPGRTSDLLKHILELAHSPAKRHLLGMRARATVLTRYNFADQSRRYADLFRALARPAREVAAP